MERLLLIDGMNLLFQMFYGMPARISGPDGRPIQGTLGFVGALLKILRWIRPTHVAVLFDGECSNPRKELDENYKANRPDYSQMPEEDTPFSQLPDLFAALDYLGIRWAETSDCEADDWLAGYARRYGSEREVIIASFDSDLFQLISPNVRILRYRGDQTTVCDEAYLWNKYGIEASRYPLWKALTGDTADNIRGVPGVGPKRASQLVQQFGSLENLLERAEEISRPSIRQAVIGSIPRLRTNDLLIRLTGSQRLPFALEELVYTPRGCTTRAVMEAVGLR